MAETSNEKFKRLAEARTQKIIDMIRLLGNCANPYIYEYEKQDVEKIFNVLESELAMTKKKFTGKVKGNDKFSL